MENPIEMNLIKIDDGDRIINRRFYLYLKNLPQKYLTEQDQSDIVNFEEHNISASPEQSEYARNYWDRVHSKKAQKEIKLNKDMFYKKMLRNFRILNNKEFIETDDSIRNLEILLHYYTKDPLFFQCKNLSDLSTPSFDKGLLIIGGVGCGKTSLMRAAEKSVVDIPGIQFKGFGANEVVELFEKNIDADEWAMKMYRGNRYYDDVKAERISDSYGKKVEVFKPIIEERSKFGCGKTYITCNYKNGAIGLEAAVEEFGERYGGRVWDRMYEMFNIVEFTGKSFRR